MTSALFVRIHQFYQNTITFFARHKTYTAFLFVILVVILGVVVFSSPKTIGDTHQVEYQTVKQYVRVSGQVQSSKDASLAFQTLGTVAYVGVKAGDSVYQGQTLATLSSGDAQASLLQAEASLSNAQAKLEQLQQGARKEEIALKEQVAMNAKSSLDQAYSSLPDTIQNVDAITADVVKNKFASVFMLNNGRYQLSFTSCDQRLQGELEEKRTRLEDVLATFQTKSTTITSISSNDSIDKAFDLAYQSALATNDLVNTISNLLLLSCSVSNPSLDGVRTTLSTVKSSMTSMFSDITLKRSSLITAKNTYNQSMRDLELTKAGTDPYVIKAQQALVAQAEAQVAQARSGLSKTMIVAPFAGVVSDVALSIGETVTSGKTVISMLATDGFEVEAKVPEVDIVKVKVGAPVDITLDAYGKSVLFPAKVTRMSPGATVEGTVPMYKVVITFVGKDDRVRQGMTANVSIITESKSHVLAIPARYVKVITQEVGSVSILGEGKEVPTEVGLGVRGGDGLIEITRGLIGNEILVPPTTTVRQAQKQTN